MAQNSPLPGTGRGHLLWMQLPGRRQGPAGDRAGRRRRQRFCRRQQKYSPPGLLQQEPIRPNFLSPQIELTGIRVFPQQTVLRWPTTAIATRAGVSLPWYNLCAMATKEFTTLFNRARPRRVCE